MDTKAKRNLRTVETGRILQKTGSLEPAHPMLLPGQDSNLRYPR